MSTAQERAKRLLDGVGVSVAASLAGPKTNRGILGRLEQMTGSPLMVRELDPLRIRVWALQGRLQASLDVQSVGDLIESLGTHGQTTPAIVRPVQGDPNAEFEVIDGSRRRFASAHLGIPLKAIVADLSDRDAALLTETADASRKHSAYETGVKWKAWLEQRLFETQDALAQWLSVSAGDLSFKLSLAELPYPFVVSLGGHERLSREVGRRLARFIGRARALERLEELRKRMSQIGELAHQGKWTAPRALVAYGELEAEIFPARRGGKQRVEETVVSSDGSLLATVASPDRSNLVVRWSKGLSVDERHELVSAINRLVAEWSESKSLAAKDSGKTLKGK
jgi:ParB family chromosome partitioning protein